jgi:hypothetical protein
MKTLIRCSPLLAGVLLLSCQPSPQQKTAPRYTISYATFFGGSAAEQGREVIVYPDGSVLVGGQTSSPDLSVTPGVVQPKYAGDDPALAS